MRYIVKHIPCGKIRGVDTLKGYSYFSNIPYATAVRWEKPVQMTSWEGEYDASTPTPYCSQLGEFSTAVSATGRFYGYENIVKQAVRYSEDCQRLNIWSPNGAQKAPVLVYIHGGSYCTGGSTAPSYCAAGYAQKGLVAVTINYRLNLFASAVGGGHTGNYGLWDQITALQWIRENIAAFGGDPDCVTVMGESAGAMSVQDLVLSPLAGGLFHRAIMMSGGGILPKEFGRRPAAEAEAVWERIRNAMGAADWAQLQKAPADKLFHTWTKLTAEYKYITPATPVVDGITIPALPEELADSGNVNGVPTVIGFLSEDMWPNTLYEAALDWGIRMEKVGKAPVYGYYFDRQLPGSDDGAFHGCDIRYAFGTFDTCWRPFEETDYRISENMMDYFASFAATGKPATSTLPTWEPLGQKQTDFLHFGDEPCAMVQVPKERLLSFQALGKPFPTRNA